MVNKVEVVETIIEFFNQVKNGKIGLFTRALKLSKFQLSGINFWLAKSLTGLIAAEIIHSKGKRLKATKKTANVQRQINPIVRLRLMDDFLSI